MQIIFTPNRKKLHYGVLTKAIEVGAVILFECCFYYPRGEAPHLNFSHWYNDWREDTQVSSDTEHTLFPLF